SESPRVPPLNDHAIGETTVGNQGTCLAHLLAAYVDAGDATAASPGDSQRWRGEAAAHVQHTLGVLEPRVLGHQVGMGVERLLQSLASAREVAEVEAVAVEEPPVIGDQIEVGAHAS